MIFNFINNQLDDLEAKLVIKSCSFSLVIKHKNNVILEVNTINYKILLLAIFLAILFSYIYIQKELLQ